MRRSFFVYYVLAWGGCVLLAFVLLRWGTTLHPGGAAPALGPAADASVLGRLAHPLGLLLIQVVVILSAARIVGALVGRIGQPAVIGEILAGILLGPSVLGLLAPEALAFLFPPASLPGLSLLSQVGVLLFMFAVGLEVDVDRLAPQARAAVIVSNVSMAVPFLLGIGFATLAYAALAPPTVPFAAFALFMGIAMSMTAFPVLARILQERGLSQSALGQTGLSCAAVGDVMAWCLLAVVIAIVKAQGLADALWTLVLTLVFAGVMIGLARRPLERAITRHFRPDGKNHALIAGMLILAFASAGVTEAIGIHALFGAFLAGALVSGRAEFRNYLHDRVQPLSSLILLPLFFALVGLRTKIGLLDSAEDWLLCAAVIAIAVAGKLGGAMLAARWSGMPWRESFALGALMNTRGLMELVVLNIGYDLGILSPRAFTMLVIMALVTTMMTGPLLSLALKPRNP